MSDYLSDLDTENTEPEIPEMLPRPKKNDPDNLTKTFEYVDRMIEVINARKKAGLDPTDLFPSSNPEDTPAYTHD